MRKQYIVLNDFDELLFNSDTQDCFFSSLAAISEAISDDLNEPEAEGEDETGRTVTITKGQLENVTRKDYKIYEYRPARR